MTHDCGKYCEWTQNCISTVLTWSSLYAIYLAEYSSKLIVKDINLLLYHVAVTDCAFYCRCNDCPHSTNNSCLARANTCYSKVERDANGVRVETKGCLPRENIGLIFCKAVGADKNVSCCYSHMCNQKTTLYLKPLKSCKCIFETMILLISSVLRTFVQCLLWRGNYGERLH